jgi:hypothetical protein
MIITETKGPPPPPTKDELRLALSRYQRRIPAQAARLSAAQAQVEAAAGALSAANTEMREATEAQDRLAAIITDITKQIGA